MGFSASSIKVSAPKFDSYSDSDNNVSFSAETVSVKSVDIDTSNKSNEKVSVETENVDLNKEVSKKTEESSFKKPDVKKIVKDTAKKVDKEYSGEKTSNMKAEKAHKFVNYYQGNYDNPYSDGTIATSGCGPTSAAMALTYMTNKKITPVETAEFGNGTYTCSDGTYWSYFEAVSDKYGVKCTQQEISSENITKGLKNGNPVIVSMGPGHFTSSGHFIVLKGIDKNGQIQVADPASEERSGQSWDLDTIVSEGKQIWTYNQ